MSKKDKPPGPVLAPTNRRPRLNARAKPWFERRAISRSNSASFSMARWRRISSTRRRRLRAMRQRPVRIRRPQQTRRFRQSTGCRRTQARAQLPMPRRASRRRLRINRPLTRRRQTRQPIQPRKAPTHRIARLDPSSLQPRGRAARSCSSTRASRGTSSWSPGCAATCRSSSSTRPGRLRADHRGTRRPAERGHHPPRYARQRGRDCARNTEMTALSVAPAQCRHGGMEGRSFRRGRIS